MGEIVFQKHSKVNCYFSPFYLMSCFCLQDQTPSCFTFAQKKYFPQNAFYTKSMPFAKGVCNYYENAQIQVFTKKGGDLSKSNAVFSL